MFSKHKEDEMGRTCSTDGEKKTAYRISVGKTEGKRPQGRPKRDGWIIQGAAS
jgi:hypothetical protein